MLDLTGFSDESLKLLLKAQEYPKGETAKAIEHEQLLRVGRRMKVVSE